MALQIDLTLDTGVEIPQAYVKVTNVILKLAGTSNSTFTCIFSCEIYKDKASRDAVMAPVIVENYTLTGSDYTTFFDYSILGNQGVNPTSQAYAYLKTLPQYSNSINV